jgi:hypothetical protein
VYFTLWANRTYVCLNYYISIHPTTNYCCAGWFPAKNPQLETNQHDEYEES